MLLALRLDRRFATHAVRAFEHWRAVLQQSGLPVPPEVADFLALCQAEASGDQAGPELATVADPLDGVSMSPLLLTYAQTEAALQCSHTQVKRLVSAGDLPTVKVGGLVRIRATDLAAYVDSLAVIPRGQAASTVQPLAAVQ